MAVLCVKGQVHKVNCVVSFCCCQQVGGGPTGVELAAEMHDYIKEDLATMFPTLKVPQHAAGIC